MRLLYTRTQARFNGWVAEDENGRLWGFRVQRKGTHGTRELINKDGVLLRVLHFFTRPLLGRLPKPFATRQDARTWLYRS